MSSKVKVDYIFNTEEAKAQGIHCVEFTKEDIMRSEILKFIIDQVEKGYYFQGKVIRYAKVVVGNKNA
jgi:hypothetical protein